MSKTASELNILRSRLLDLTLRNNLLSYKPSSARTIEIAGENPEDVYKKLVTLEKGLRFYPTEKAAKETVEEKRFWDLPKFSKPTAKQQEITLTTPYDEVTLRKRLYALANKSRTVFEEQGYPILYLALGFIVWTEAEHQSKPLKAPLLLVPVELQRLKVKDNYNLLWTGEDAMTSLSLIAKLAEQGVTLPEFAMTEDEGELAAYFAEVREAIQKKGWELIPEISLDLFSFRKFVMFKDLDPESWDENFSLEDHELIANIFHPENSPAPKEEQEFLEHDVDTRLPSEKSYNILDADSSQVAVIEEAKAGKNLVVEGPPGTGKSQTIANMIGELLVQGKTVLFVSEKMAALEVVKRRLDNAGLSRFCLELHSQKAKKGEVIKELEHCFAYAGSTTPGSSTDALSMQIDSLRDELDGYCTELSRPIGACEFTPYDLFGIREQYRYEFEDSSEGPKTRIARIALPDPKEITPEEYKDAVTKLNDIEALLPILMPTGRPLSQHPWAGSNLGMVMPQDKEEILDLIDAYRAAIERLLSSMRMLSDLTGVPVPRDEMGISRMIEACRVLTGGFTTNKEALTNPVWDKQVEVSRLLDTTEKFSNLRWKVFTTFKPEILGRDPIKLHDRFKEVSEKGALSKIFSGAYKETKAEITTLYKTPVPSDKQILEDLQIAVDYLSFRDIWKQDEGKYLSAFSPIWDDELTDPAKMREYADWTAGLHLMIKEGFASQKTVELLCGDGIMVREVIPLFSEVEAAAKQHSETRAKLFARIGISEALDPTFAEQRKACDLWSSDLDGVVLWSKFQTYVSEAEKTVAAPLMEALLTDRIKPGSLIPTFLTSYANSLLREAFTERPLLARFAGASHEQKIATFAACDREAIVSNSLRIVRTVESRIPELYTGASKESEMGVLTGEFNRKRGHMSIRMLMSRAGGLIQQVKPCFMMSPLSVAQYLDPRSVQFDVIIFDEASQVKPEDALGALMRGKQLVVMGDSRQLPPTSFFDQIAGGEEEDEVESVASVTDMESLLNVCKQTYPTKRLRWHYRSRHESLIAVSNQEFYDGTLMIFPSPMHETTELGLSFVHLPDTFYDRGKTGVNKGEAKAVAEAVIEYYERFPDKSLGVATFSTKQQEAIRQEVEVLLRDHPEIEALMRPDNGEHFFVKNLETVQGDERDTMLISIGYGFDENHRLSRNFGPLNQDGGERRLNVLITRARERSVVFANFRGTDLITEGSSPSGLAALSTFLRYAEDHSAALMSGNGTADDVAGLFTSTVARFLEDSGYSVEKNVGCAGFRIDIAVEDPRANGVYLAGIICDGPFYWTSPVARDRDRLRLQILEGLGWNLIRIWSPEWYQHPQACMKKLLEEIEEAKKPKRKSSAKPKPAPKSEETPKKTVKVDEPKEPKEPKEAEEPEVIDEPVLEKPKPKRAPRKKPEPKPEPVSEKKEPVPKRETPKSSQPAPQIVVSRAGFAPYAMCVECSLGSYHQFGSVPDSVLATSIVQIISVEGPISENMLITRVRDLGRVTRMTPAIKKNIADIAENEVLEGRLVCDDEGFFAVPESQIVPRPRPSKWSCDDVSLSEIAVASVAVLTKQFATPKDDLVRQIAVVFGFKVTEGVRERVRKGVDLAISSGLITCEDGVCKVA